MAGTMITDLQHFLARDGSIGPQSGPARRIAEYLCSIIKEMTADMAGLAHVERVRCRRRPNHKPCPGEIESFVDPETGQIIWQCPVCDDNGTIDNWQGTQWDLSDTLQGYSKN